MIHAFLCSEEGHPAAPTNLDISVPAECSIKAHRESVRRDSRSGYTSYKPEWLDMTIEDAIKLRKELNRVLRGRR